MSRVSEVDHRWVEEFLFSYEFPVAWYVAGKFSLIRKKYLVIIIAFNMWLVDSVLEVTPLMLVPFRLIPMFSVWVFLPTVDRLGRIE